MSDGIIAQDCASPRPGFVALARTTARDMAKLFPTFFAAVVFSTILKLYVPSDFVYNVLGKNMWTAVPLATVAGVILPIPRYATYPIALALMQKGAPLAVVYSLIAGEVILGSLERDIMELQFFGWKSYLLRMLLCTVFVIATGYLMAVVQ